MQSFSKTYYILMSLGVVSLTVLMYLTFNGIPAGQRVEMTDRVTAFKGEKLEASGIAAVPGTDGVLMVDNGRNGQVFWMQFDQTGKQAGAIKPIDLGVNIEDIEGITTDGSYFYVVSSHSRPKAIAGAGMVRFKFDPRTQSIGEVTAINGLKSFLIDNVAELRDEGDRKSKDGGVNIEGLAWDPRRNRLLLGLRSPIVNGEALLVPIRLRDPRGAFSIDNLGVESGKAIHLSLEGIGIRSIEYDVSANVFRIISGAAEDQSQTDFGLWEWNDDQGQRVLRLTSKFERRLKPEGVVRVTAGNKNFLIVVFDSSGYTVVD